MGFDERARAFRELRALCIAHRIDLLPERWLHDPELRANIEREGITLFRRTGPAD